MLLHTQNGNVKMIIAFTILINLLIMRGSLSACNVKQVDAERVDCAFGGINKDICENDRHCCWKRAASPTIPWCYYGQGLALNFTVNTVTGCEHDDYFNFSCSPNQHIHILNVFYGYYQGSRCHNHCNKPKCDICSTKNGTDIVNQYCECNSSCTVDLKSDEWNTHTYCDDFNKFMHVQYLCIDKTKGLLNCPGPSSSRLPIGTSTTSLLYHSSLSLATSRKQEVPFNMSGTLTFTSRSTANGSSSLASKQPALTSFTVQVRSTRLSLVPNQTSKTVILSNVSSATISTETLIRPTIVLPTTGVINTKTSLNNLTITTGTLPVTKSGQYSLFQSTLLLLNTTSVIMKFSSSKVSAIGSSQMKPSRNRTESTVVLSSTSKVVSTASVVGENATSMGVASSSQMFSSSPIILNPNITSFNSPATQISETVKLNSTSIKAGMTSLPILSNRTSARSSQIAITSQATSSSSVPPPTMGTSPPLGNTVTSISQKTSLPTGAALSSKHPLASSIIHASLSVSERSPSIAKSSVGKRSPVVTSSSSIHKGIPSPTTEQPLFSSFSSGVNPTGKSSPKRSLSTAAKVGISVAVCVILLAMLLVVVLCYRRRTTKNQFRYLDDFAPAPGTYSSIDPTMVQMSDLDQGGYDGDNNPQSAYDNVGLVNDG